MKEAIRAVVVGADVLGLAAARMLARHGAEVTLIERSRRCGGAWLGFDVDHELRFDRGLRLAPATGDRRLDHALYGSLDLAWRRGEGYPRAGHVLGGRLSTRTACPDARPLGEDECMRALLEIHPSSTGARAPDLAASLVERFGPTLTEAIYRPLVRKLWGVELEELAHDADLDVLPSRVVLTDRGQTERHMRESAELRRRLAHPSSRDLAAAGRGWFYPARGPMSQWVRASVDDLERRRGARLRLESQVEGLDRDAEGGRVTGVRLAHGERVRCDVLVWTEEVQALLRAARTPTPSAPTRPRDLALVHLLADREPSTDLSFAELYDPQHAASRAVFYRAMRPRPTDRERRAVTCEVPLSADAGLDPKRLAARVMSELREVGLMPASASVERAWVERTTNAYPVRTPAVAEAERSGRRIAGELENVAIVPRQPSAVLTPTALRALDRQVSNLIGCAPVAFAA